MTEAMPTEPLVSDLPELADVSGAIAEVADTPITRVWVVGMTGAGKSTFAEQLAQLLGGPHVELDSLYWLPDWEVRDNVQFLNQLREQLKGPVWVVDGQYQTAVDAYLGQATCVVFLDPPLITARVRLIRRTLRRLITRAPICGDNRESLRSAFGPTSIILYALREHRNQRRDNEALVRRVEESGTVVIRSRWTKPAEVAVMMAERIAGPPLN